MRLIEELERRLGAEESPFRVQLLREDIARLGALRELARRTGELTACKKAALRLGWTPADLRTHEIREPIEVLAEAIYFYEGGAAGADPEARIIAAWTELHRARMERLVGCLSTPVPKPVDPGIGGP